MARETLQIDIVATDRASGVFKGMASSLGQIDKTVKDTAKTVEHLNMMFVGQDLLRGARTMATGLTGLAKASSDVAEAQNYVDQVFKDSSATIKDWAKTAAASTLLSESAALDAAATFGVFGKQIGLTGNELAKFSTGFVQLAADMASIKNTSVDQAINAIAASFRNEQTPIRQYGVLLSETSIKAKALALGIYDGTGKLSEQQRIVASTQMIYEQLGYAIGDVGRTIDGFANQQRLLGANFENFKANIGDALLPMFNSIMTGANQAMEAFQKLPEPVQNFAVRAAAAGTAIVGLAGGLLFTVGKVGQAVVAFKDLRESMQNWVANAGRAGQAAAGVGKALGAIGVGLVAVELIGQTFNDITNAAGKTADAIDDITIALAKTDSAGAIDAFQRLAKAQDEMFKFSGLWEDFGKELQVGLDGPIVSIENLDDSFQALLKNSGPSAAAAMLDALNMQAQGLDKNSRAYKDAVTIINRYTPDVQRATQAAQAQGEETGLTAEQLARYGDSSLAAADATNPLQEGIDKANDTMAEYRANLIKAESAQTSMADKVDDFSTAIDNAFGTSDWVDNLSEGFSSIQDLVDGIKESEGAARKGAEGLDLYTEAGRDQLSTIDDLAQTIGEDITRAYKESGGDIDKARETMVGWRTEVEKQLRQAGIAEPVIKKYVDALNLTDDTFTSVIQLQFQEEQKRKFDALRLELENLPPSVATKITAAIDAGDWNAAYEEGKAFIERSAPVEQPVTATPDPAAASETKDYFDILFGRNVDQPVESTDDNSNRMKSWLRGIFALAVQQPVNSTDQNSGTTKQGIWSVFANAINQTIATSNTDAGGTRGGIRSTFDPPVRQRVDTYNDNANSTKNSIWSIFQNPITQRVSVVPSSSGSAGATGAPRPTSTQGRAARPTADEGGGAQTFGLMTASADEGMPQPVTAGAAAPTSTPSITNLHVYMPVGTNEIAVVDSLRNYQRNNGTPVGR